jgi:hypothetical protein
MNLVGATIIDNGTVPTPMRGRIVQVFSDMSVSVTWHGTSTQASTIRPQHMTAGRYTVEVSK